MSWGTEDLTCHTEVFHLHHCSKRQAVSQGITCSTASSLESCIMFLSEKTATARRSPPARPQLMEWGSWGRCCLCSALLFPRHATYRAYIVLGGVGYSLGQSVAVTRSALTQCQAFLILASLLRCPTVWIRKLRLTEPK